MNSTFEAPISIDEVMGSRSISLTTSISWTSRNGIENTGFIPDIDLLEEIQDRAKSQLDKDISDYELDEYGSLDIGSVEISPEDQEVVSVEVDVE